jgi:hypothetical protein
MSNPAPLLTINDANLDKFSYSILVRDAESNTLGLEQFVSALSIKQELIRNSMILEMKMSDSFGILDRSIIQVGSVVIVQLCKDPTGELPDSKIFRKAFVVTRIDNNIQSAQLKQRVFSVTAYSLAGISNAWPLSYSDYSGPTKPTDIIKQIVQKTFIEKFQKSAEKYSGELVSKIVEDNGKWIDSTNEIKNGILLHQVKPFDAISHLIAKSVSPDNSEYFFYEDFNGFNLRTLKSMKNDSNGNEKTFIYYQDKTQRFGDEENELVPDYSRILYLTQHKQQDYFELVQGGAVINQVAVFDIINKEVIKKDFKYNTSANKAFVLGSKTAYPAGLFPFLTFTENPPYKKDKEKPQPYPYDIAPHSKIAISEKAWNRDDYLLDNYNIPVAQRTLMEQNKITIEIYGNPSILPGDIIKMKVPTKSGIDSDLESLIRRQSGKFLVGAVKHNILGTKFQTFLDLYVDSYDEKVTEVLKDKSSEST